MRRILRRRNSRVSVYQEPRPRRLGSTAGKLSARIGCRFNFHRVARSGHNQSGNPLRLGVHRAIGVSKDFTISQRNLMCVCRTLNQCSILLWPEICLSLQSSAGLKGPVPDSRRGLDTMDDDSRLTDARAIAMNAVLSNARKFSGREAYEVWRVMQLIANNRPCAGVPDTVIQLAMRCNHFPEVWKVVATKALAHERRAGKRNSYR